MSVIDRLTDEAIGHTVDLMRYDARQRQEMLGILEKLRDELSIKVAAFDAKSSKSAAANLARSRDLLNDVKGIINSTYQSIGARSRASLIDVAAVEQRHIARSLNSTLEAHLVDVNVSLPQLEKLVDKTLILGAPASEWWKRQSVGLQERFADQIRMGVMQGETTDEMIKRIRGTYTGKKITVVDEAGKSKKVNQFTGGIMQTTTREAEALVRTSVQSIANATRMDSFAQNSDIIQGAQILVALDNRTSAICMARSMMAWKLNGEPIEATGARGKFPGPPPYHYNCRSTLIPYLRPITDFIKSKKLTDAQKDKINQIWNEDTQATPDGPVSGKLNYEQWLKTKDPAYQKEVLGPGRWKLWNEGKLTFPDLIDQSGNSISLKDLAKRADAPPAPAAPARPPISLKELSQMMKDRGATLSLRNDPQVAMIDDLQAIMGEGWNDFISSYVDVLDAFPKGTRACLEFQRVLEKGVTDVIGVRLMNLSTYDDILVREIKLAEKTVYNELFELPDALQGKGLAKNVLAKQFKAYSASPGVEKVDVHAALSAGAYTWARFGFLPTQKDWQKILIEAMDQGSEKIAKLAEQLTRSQVGPEGLWSIADHPEGKAFLRKRSWHGSFDFSNPDQVARFEAYVGVDLPKKAVK